MLSCSTSCIFHSQLKSFPWRSESPATLLRGPSPVASAHPAPTALHPRPPGNSTPPPATVFGTQGFFKYMLISLASYPPAEQRTPGPLQEAPATQTSSADPAPQANKVPNVEEDAGAQGGLHPSSAHGFLGPSSQEATPDTPPYHPLWALVAAGLTGINKFEVQDSPGAQQQHGSGTNSSSLPVLQSAPPLSPPAAYRSAQEWDLQQQQAQVEGDEVTAPIKTATAEHNLFLCNLTLGSVRNGDILSTLSCFSCR